MDSNVTFDRTNDPGKGPRNSGQTKGKELKNKNSNTALVPKTKCEELMVRPVHGNVVEGVGDIRRTPPHGPRNGTDNAFNRLHSESGDLEVQVEN